MKFSSTDAIAAHLLENPNIHMLQIDDSGISSLPSLPESLRRLFISNCPRLTELSILPSSLTELVVDNCPGLVSLPKLPSLKVLVIGRCPGITVLPALPASLTYVKVYA